MTRETIEFLLKLLAHLKISPLQPDALEVTQLSIKAQAELVEELKNVIALTSQT